MKRTSTLAAVLASAVTATSLSGCISGTKVGTWTEQQQARITESDAFVVTEGNSNDHTHNVYAVANGQVVGHLTGFGGGLSAKGIHRIEAFGDDMVLISLDKGADNYYWAMKTADAVDFYTKIAGADEGITVKAKQIELDQNAAPAVTPAP